jgi:hypothetical protein
MKNLREFLVRSIYRYVLPFFVWLFYKCLSSTWRLTVHEPAALRQLLKEKKPVILAHWHGDEIPLMSVIGRYQTATITSTSVDGDLMNQVVRLLGGVTVRGSSTRGGISALKGLLRIVKDQKKNTSFAVDGPKGPIYKVKPGVFEVSRLMNASIFPCGVFCDRAWVFTRSWNKTYLPKPFAKVKILWGAAVGPISRDQDPHDPALATELEEALHYLRANALKNNFAQ